MQYYNNTNTINIEILQTHSLSHLVTAGLGIERGEGLQLQYFYSWGIQIRKSFLPKKTKVQANTIDMSNLLLKLVSLYVAFDIFAKGASLAKVLASPLEFVLPSRN